MVGYGVQSEPKWHVVLGNHAAKLHLYGKAEPRISRKMGHINFVGNNPTEVAVACSEAINVLHIQR